MPSPTRPWVDAFADEMEAKLAENRHKGDRSGWRFEPPGLLLSKLIREVAELAEAVDNASEADRDILTYSEAQRAVFREAVRREAADVANFAMMLADVAGGMKPKLGAEDAS